MKTNEEITGVAVVDSDSVIACGHAYNQLSTFGTTVITSSTDDQYDAILWKVCVPCFIRGRTPTFLSDTTNQFSKIHKEGV